MDDTASRRLASDTTAPRPLPDPKAADAHALTVLFSPDPTSIGRVLQLPDRRLEIGRQPTPPCLVVRDPLASRIHASVTWDAGRERYVLEDQGSRNATVLNGQELEREILASGDVIRVGDTVLRFAHLDMEVVGWQAPAPSLLRGRSLGLRRVLDQAKRAATADLAVLIEGATGTGKELVAREIHRLSGRRGPFQAVNCAAIPADLMESELFGHRKGAFSGAVRDQTGMLRAASKGTVFLDEIGELAPTLQSKLLRVLDEKRVRPVGNSRTESIDVRFVSATNRDLEEQVRDGTFRADLYARINQWPIVVPPLRERPDDLLPIFLEVVRQHGGGKPYVMTGDFFEGLALYDWPYNVRELVSLARRVMVLLPEGGRLELAHLPEAMRPGRASSQTITAAAASESLPARGEVPTGRELAALLRHYKGNVTEVAQHTGRERAQIYRWLRRYGLKPDEFRDRNGGSR